MIKPMPEIVAISEHPMNQPCLYSFRRCPYAIRARMALAYAGIRVELREIKLTNMPPELKELSPKATVPVLRTVDGMVFEQSLDIMYWAVSVSDPEQWLPENPASKDLIAQNDEEFKPLLDSYKYADRFPQLSQTKHRNIAEFFLGLLEDKLTTQPFLTGERKTICDVAIMPFIRQFAAVEPKWFEQSRYVRVRVWLDRQLESELFQAVMKKYVFWQPGDTAVYFGG